MTARSYIYDIITTDPLLNSYGITADSTFTQHTIDTPQVRPMCILRWQLTAEGVGTINQRVLTIWVHENKNTGDYDRIDQSLNRLRTILTNVAGANVGDGGGWLSSIRWEGDSDDLRDDELGTITRNAQFRLTGSAI